MKLRLTLTLTLTMNCTKSCTRQSGSSTQVSEPHGRARRHYFAALRLERHSTLVIVVVVVVTLVVLTSLSRLGAGADSCGTIDKDISHIHIFTSCTYPTRLFCPIPFPFCVAVFSRDYYTRIARQQPTPRKRYACVHT